ncbi:MAG: VCBS repeat-containing protein [Planctomycetota bacterium]
MAESDRPRSYQNAVEALEPRVLFNGDAGLGVEPDEVTFAKIALEEGASDKVFADERPVAVGDFNRDGNLDLTSGPTTWLGQGDGTFAEGIDTGLDTVIDNDKSFSFVEDLNGDGVLDIAFTNQGDLSEYVVVVTGNGDGTFAEAHRSATGLHARYRFDRVTSGDFNGDGHTDLAAVYDYTYGPAYGPGHVVLFWGRGDATFSAGEEVSPEPQRFLSVASGDFNEDKIDDLILIKSDGETRLLLGSADGVFVDRGVLTTLENSWKFAAASGDFDGDGHLDLAVHHYIESPSTSGGGTGGVSRSNELVFLFGRGDATFDAPRATAVSTGAWELATADFNNDGYLDVAIGELFTDHGVPIVFGSASRSEFAVVEVAEQVSDAGTVLVPGDFDNDGDVDLFSVGPEEPNADLLINQSTTASSSPPAGSVLVGFDKMKTKATESGKKAKFRVVRQGNLSGSLKVKLKFGGEAKYRKDYTLKVSSGGKMKGKHLLMPAGKKSVKVKLIPQDDKKREGDESVQIALVQTAAVSLPADVPSLRSLFETEIEDNDGGARAPDGPSTLG